MSKDKSNEAFDPLLDEAPSRYVVGIDLGTTNSAVTYIDTNKDDWQIRLFPLPQVTAANSVEARDTLPSFHLQPSPQDVESQALALPWSSGDQNWCVGVMARDEGIKSPGRLCASAKSWLCHSGVDREAKLLPWQPVDDVERLSPVEVTARYLSHIRSAWNAHFSREKLEEQDIVITLPASFDEVARELTVQAAAEAGLDNIVLIEEPQAAFYAWVYKHENEWFHLVEAGHNILVCDIGGGTSDFTLIKVRRSEVEAPTPVEGNPSGTTDDSNSSQRVQFHRVAVGDHLILGGDNLDIALAHFLENKIAKGQKLTPNQWDVLVRSCRRVKETLLADDAPETATVNLPGRGSKLIGGGLQAEVTRAEVEKLLVDGFLPKNDLRDRPTHAQSGFREFGLPFASDPAITKHLASFLDAHGEAKEENDARTAIRPDAILFNGGFFASEVLKRRLLAVLTSWFDAGDTYAPTVLDNDRLDLAVARGAAYYGMVRRGEGVRIAANLARSYYVEVDSTDSANQAICLVPGQAEPGQEIRLDSLPLELTVSQPVEFSLHVSSTRLTDKPGDVVSLHPEQMKALPPIRTVLRTERRNQTGTIPVALHAHLSEIGTIDLWCQATETDHKWRLQFDVRSTTQTDRDAYESAKEEEGVVDEATWQDCESIIEAVFGEAGEEKPSKILRRLSDRLGVGKLDWPTSLLRRIWEKLLELQEGRKKSPGHEARWLNLLGFSLRPGYGLAVDDWRVAETWRHVNRKLVHGGASKSEALILWRRISGGLSPGQQSAIAEPMISSLRATHSILIHQRQSRGEPMYPMHESDEAWRLLGSLEHLDRSTKLQVGKMLLDLFPKRRFEKVRSSMLWCLGRLGQRQPMYGPLNGLLAAHEVYGWFETICELEKSAPELRAEFQHAVMQLARRTKDRYRDLEESSRDSIIRWLKDSSATPRLIELVSEGGELQESEQADVFGESLPKGIRVRM